MVVYLYMSALMGCQPVQGASCTAVSGSSSTLPCMEYAAIDNGWMDGKLKHLKCFSEYHLVAICLSGAPLDLCMKKNTGIVMLCSGTGVIKCQHSASHPKINPQRRLLFLLENNFTSFQCLLRVALKLIRVYQLRLFCRKTAVEYKRFSNFLTFCAIMHEAQASGWSAPTWYAFPPTFFFCLLFIAGICEPYVFFHEKIKISFWLWKKTS